MMTESKMSRQQRNIDLHRRIRYIIAQLAVIDCCQLA